MTKAEREQLIAAQNQVTALQAKVYELEKNLAEAKRTSDMWYRNVQELTTEIGAVHDVFDSLPNASKRKCEDSYTDRKLMTRLAGYFAANRA